MTTIDFTTAQLAETAITEIFTDFERIGRNLSFIKTLQVKDMKGMYKEGNALAPFVEKAYQVSKDHPEILPSIFNVAEFQRQYELSKNLGPISNRANELAESLVNTFTALKSNLLAMALEVYTAVKVNRDKVPGLNVVADEMAAFFKKTRSKLKSALQKIL